MPCVLLPDKPHTGKKNTARLESLNPGILPGDWGMEGRKNIQYHLLQGHWAKDVQKDYHQTLARIIWDLAFRHGKDKQQAQNKYIILNFWRDTNIQLPTCIWAKVKLFFHASQEIPKSEKDGNNCGFNKQTFTNSSLVFGLTLHLSIKVRAEKG